MPDETGFRFSRLPSQYGLWHLHGHNCVYPGEHGLHNISLPKWPWSSNTERVSTTRNDTIISMMEKTKPYRLISGVT